MSSLPVPPSAVAGASDPRAASRASRALAAGLALASLPALLFPGDAPFINDEPLLIIEALNRNAAHQLAAHGLAGNRGLLYGPLPTWIYQLLLGFTHDPVTLVLVHALLLGLGVGIALYLLARDLRLWAPFAIVILLSPVIWFQERQLWDNTFNVPLCALTLAAYTRFLATRSRAALALAVAGVVVAPFIHLMALAFVVPMALHLLVFERRALLRNARVVLPFPVLFLGASVPYLGMAVRALSAPAMLGATSNTSSVASGLTFPLLGGRVLSALEVYDWAPGPLTHAARLVTAVAYPLVWAGIGLAAMRVLSVLRGRRAAELRDHVAGLAVGIVVCQSLLDGALKVALHTHYFNATWIAYAFLAWLVVDALVRARSRAWRVLGLVAPLHGIALLVVDVALVWATHTAPGKQYGATIANQVEVARTLSGYPSGTPITSDVYPYRDFPHALTAMQMLLGPAPAPVASARTLAIRTRPGPPGDGWAVVVPE